MRYVDTGSGDPEQALGSWLSAVLADPTAITELRWQSAFFSAAVLGYFQPALGQMRAASGVVRLLIGSNDGCTRSTDVLATLGAIDGIQPTAALGVVSFDNAYFHPKVIHMVRSDGSATAYVGSANLTRPGVTGVHVEAGVCFDSRDGDPVAILAAIAGAVDAWFSGGVGGVAVVQSSQDVDALVALHRLDVIPPGTRTGGTGSSRGGDGPERERRLALVEIPGLAEWHEAETFEAGDESDSEEGLDTAATSSMRITPPSIVVTYSKQLTRSDAQRKKSGNQRGSITLVEAGQPIDGQTHFRRQLFAEAPWILAQTKTGKELEVAWIEFDVEVNGTARGTMKLMASYAENRESGQNNYTSLLHLGDLGPLFADQDMTGKTLAIEAEAGGRYRLTIG